MTKTFCLYFYEGSASGEEFFISDEVCAVPSVGTEIRMIGDARVWKVDHLIWTLPLVEKSPLIVVDVICSEVQQ